MEGKLALDGWQLVAVLDGRILLAYFLLDCFKSGQLGLLRLLSVDESAVNLQIPQVQQQACLNSFASNIIQNKVLDCEPEPGGCGCGFSGELNLALLIAKNLEQGCY